MLQCVLQLQMRQSVSVRCSVSQCIAVCRSVSCSRSIAMCVAPVDEDSSPSKGREVFVLGAVT